MDDVYFFIWASTTSLFSVEGSIAKGKTKYFVGQSAAEFSDTLGTKCSISSPASFVDCNIYDFVLHSNSSSPEEAATLDSLNFEGNLNTATSMKQYQYYVFELKDTTQNIEGFPEQIKIKPKSGGTEITISKVKALGMDSVSQSFAFVL